MTRDDLDDALAAMDRALRDQPDVVYEDLVEAVRALVRLRDTLICEKRRGGTVADRLDRLNATLSLVVAAEYPLEGVRRQRVEAARRELASIPLSP
jgi:hypothetical protein